MSGDEWVKIITAVFAGIASVFGAWSVAQNRRLQRGQDRHERRAEARNQRLAGEIDDCDEKDKP